MEMEEGEKVTGSANSVQRIKEQLLTEQKQIKENGQLPYKYLKPSCRIKTGWWKEEFDLRFDEIKDTMVTKGILSVVTTFYPEVKKY